MTESGELYMIWINWEDQIVSFHEVPGFDRLPFGSEAKLAGQYPDSFNGRLPVSVRRWSCAKEI